MIRVSCQSCNKPLSIDETKLPMQPVSFPCPLCKVKMTIDRSALPEGDSPASLATSGPVVADVEMRGSALIIGAASEPLAQAVRSVGLQAKFVDSAEAAREIYLRDFPAAVLFHASKLTPPPLQEIAPMIAIGPIDRRRGFFILLADGLRTFDGNAAFLYGVNLVVAPRDLPSFAAIYREAEASHQRLYATMNALAEQA